ncbi:tetratricopeptide repeat protein, partial [Actinomyces oris]|uniref:tetratricopeptide repeat protein n=1 Tax=Actinomyces oris TaxID=544580 RepID=UPI000A7C648E
MREPVTWDRVADPAGIAAVVHPGWVQRALTAEDWRGFPGNEPGGGEGVARVERIAQQIFDKLAELHITYVYEPAESVPGAQRVRAVDEVLSLGQATCLDMCATFCSAALDAGIYPLLLTVRQDEHRRHALVLVPVDLRWSFGVPALLDEGFSRSPLVIDGDDVRDLVANVPDDAVGSWLAIDVEQATYSADRDAGDWACAIASGASYVKEWDWDVCVDVGGIRAQQDNSSELPTLARTEKVLASGYLPLPDDSTPLQMIQTRYGVVPFCSRPEYRGLKEWALGTAKSPGRKPDVSVSVLTGAGGTGKTRMAAQLCHELEVLGWYTGFAPAKSTMKNDELTYLAELTTELLVVVDYAEESRQEQLAALLRALRGRRSPTRIVLTARGIDSWWEDFRQELESDGIQLGQVLVKELEPRPDPVLLYRQAVRGFSKVINGVNPPEVAIPEHAGDTALDIVLRAWLAVVDDSGMQDPQSERSVEEGARSARAANLNARDSLYDRVLRLEFNRWRTFPELQDISLIHLRRIAATLSLLAPDTNQVDNVLSRLPEWRDEHLRRSRVAELMSTTLLRSDGDGGISLRPDPVAEHLILSVFGDEVDQVDAVLPGDPLDVPGISEPDASEATVTRAIMLGQQAQNLSQVITRAASQDRESAVKLARQILKACPYLWSSALEVALAQGGPFVDALEHLIESGAELPCEEIEGSIPLGHSALQGTALAALQRMEVSAERDPVQRACYLHNLANRLSDVGRSGEALEAAEEAAGLFRALVEASPEAYTPDLAMSLNNLANRLLGVGRRGEALEVAEEAEGLYRVLVEASPEAYTPDLAMSLSNLANRLSDVGRSGEALEAAEEAAGLRRALVEASPAAYTPDLAMSLSNLANRLSDVGRSG